MMVPGKTIRKKKINQNFKLNYKKAIWNKCKTTNMFKKIKWHKILNNKKILNQLINKNPIYIFILNIYIYI